MINKGEFEIGSVSKFFYSFITDEILDLVFLGKVGCLVIVLLSA